jgi:triosephosphate isomerase
MSAVTMMARKPIIAGNWKMNPEGIDEAIALGKGIAEKAAGQDKAEVLLCVPHVYITSIIDELKDSNVNIGAQSVYFEDKGAFTGAVSTCMVKSVGVTHVLSGHSERRVIFKNDDSAVNRKTRKILDAGLNCMLCIGESKEEYEGKLAEAICATQLSKDLAGVTKEQMARVSIAYEPVWAIGTGLVCASDDAQKIHEYIRKWLAVLYDEETADSVRILYGGSVTPESVDDLMSKPDIDGCLVGGASLDADKFGRIINFK